MTTSTTDAEAIAREVGRAVLRVEQMFNAKLIERAKARVVDDATSAILSYLASRQEAQEPVAWRVTYADGGTVYLHHKPSGDSGVYECTPLFTAPSPAPAGEVERLRAAIKRQVENIDRWRETGEPASPEESKSIYEQLVAALNGGREKGK